MGHFVSDAGGVFYHTTNPPTQPKNQQQSGGSPPSGAASHQPTPRVRAAVSVGTSVTRDLGCVLQTPVVVSTRVSGLHCTFAVQRFLGPQGLPLAELPRPGASIVGSWAGALYTILRRTLSTCQVAPKSSNCGFLCRRVWRRARLGGTRWTATLLPTSRCGARACSSRLVGRKISSRHTPDS